MSNVKNSAVSYSRISTIIVVVVCGFTSGLPLSLTASTLQAWLSEFDSVSLTAIGALSLVGLPYTLKWLWAPCLDRFLPSAIGRRRGWMIIAQLGITLGLLGMSLGSEPYWYGIVFFAFFVAFMSATQDIASDAYRIDLLDTKDYGVGATAVQYGYRLAMIVSGGFAIIMSDLIGWAWTYRSMAALMMMNAWFTYKMPEPFVSYARPKSISSAYWGPIRHFLSRHACMLWLALVILYKFTDAFGLSLNTVFLLRGLAYSKLEVGASMKMTSIFGALLGSAGAAVAMQRWSLYRCLWVFGLLQGIAHLGFAYHAWIGGHHLYLMISVVFLEFFMSGMGSVAFVALLMRLCHKRFAAAQFALLTSVASLGRVFTGYFAGSFAEAYGWVAFYMLAVVVALPSLALLYALREDKIFKN